MRTIVPLQRFFVHHTLQNEDPAIVNAKHQNFYLEFLNVTLLFKNRNKKIE